MNMTLALNLENKEIIVTGFIENKNEAKKCSKERAEELNCNSYCVIDLSSKNIQIIKNQIICWLASIDIIGLEAYDIVDKILSKLDEILEGI